MDIDSNEHCQLTEWDFEQIAERKYLNFSQYHLVLVRGLMSQWQLSNDQSHMMAVSRFPMSSHLVIDELKVRGLEASLADLEEFWFELHREMIDSSRLQWSAKSIENFIEWALSKDRVKPIPERTPHIQKFLQDRNFVLAAYELETAVREVCE